MSQERFPTASIRPRLGVLQHRGSSATPSLQNPPHALHLRVHTDPATDYKYDPAVNLCSTSTVC